MIGGVDIIIPASGDSSAMDVCARIVQRCWQQARFEDAVTGETYSEYAEIPIGRVRELLAYRDCEAAAAWNADTAVSPPNSMLYLILSANSVTMVVDDPDAADVSAIIRSIRATLEMDILNTFAEAA